MVDIKLTNKEKLLVSIAKQGKNLSEFARLIGISNSYLSQIINGKRTPSAKVAYSISKAIDQPMENIFSIKSHDY